MFVPTATRVSEHTQPDINRRIEQRTERILRHYRAHPDQIDDRLRELDREWDTERTLQTNFAVIVLASVALGMLVDRRWLLLGGLASGFMLQHALQGWCPPLPVFRRLGVRTGREIEDERAALLRASERETIADD